MMLALLPVLLVSCFKKQPEPEADFSTPEGAILCLEEAYRQGDLEAAISCKDFWMEAQYMLESKFRDRIPEAGSDQEIIKRTAEVLELSFRKEIGQTGLPDFSQVRSTFPAKVKVRDDIYRVNEVCHFPDGRTSKQDILVGRRNGEWKVLNPVADENK